MAKRGRIKAFRVKLQGKRDLKRKLKAHLYDKGEVFEPIDRLGVLPEKEWKKLKRRLK